MINLTLFSVFEKFSKPIYLISTKLIFYPYRAI